MKQKIMQKVIKKIWKLEEEEIPRVKKISCGKPNCTKCPHGYYLYARSKKNRKYIDRYVGKCSKIGLPR